MFSTRVGLWVEEVNLNGGCIILVQVGVSVVLYPLMSRSGCVSGIETAD